MSDGKQQIINSNPTDFEECFPGRFIKGAELVGDRARLTLTIAGCHVELLEGSEGAKIKGILSFRDEPKQLPLSKTVGLCIREMFGRRIADWKGKRITLYQDFWNGDPCTRIWGSPDIDRDMQCVIALARRKPRTVTLHRVIEQPVTAALGDGLSDRCREVLALMATAGSVNELHSLRSEYITERFEGREPGLLAKAFVRREQQLKPVDAEGEAAPSAETGA